MRLIPRYEGDLKSLRTGSFVEAVLDDQKTPARGWGLDGTVQEFKALTPLLGQSIAVVAADVMLSCCDQRHSAEKVLGLIIERDPNDRRKWVLVDHRFTTRIAHCPWCGARLSGEAT